MKSGIPENSKKNFQKNFQKLEVFIIKQINYENKINRKRFITYR